MSCIIIVVVISPWKYLCYKYNNVLNHKFKVKYLSPYKLTNKNRSYFQREQKREENKICVIFILKQLKKKPKAKQNKKNQNSKQPKKAHKNYKSN